MRELLLAVVLLASRCCESFRPCVTLRSRPLKSLEAFKNEGPFQVMQDAMGLTGMLPSENDDGEKQIYYGVLTKKATDRPDEATRERLRAEAAERLTNIDGDERARRMLVGNVFLGVAFAVAITTTCGGDDSLGDHIGRFVRFSLPFVFGFAYRDSGREGL